LLARGTAFVDEAQKLRNDLQKESNNAASLLDAIGKWWNGNSTTSTSEPATTKSATEPKTESTSQPEPPILSKQPVPLQAPSTTESAKLVSSSSPTEQSPIAPKSPALTSDELLLRNLGASEFTEPIVSSQPEPTVSLVPLSASRDRFQRRSASERTIRPPDLLLNTTMEAPSQKAATLFSPQERQPATKWDPKIWAQSLEGTKTL
jgi:hypothetical protein